MKARLLLLAGTQQGKSYVLPEGEMSIGRESGCDICLEESAVSRRHCLIRHTAQGYELLDLDSLNGTFVEGVKVSSQLLTAGQRIRIGDASLLFLLDEEDARQTVPTSLRVAFESDETRQRTTITLEIENSFYLSPDKVESALENATRLTRDLGVLLRVGREINSLTTLAALQTQLLELIFEITPAQQAAMALGTHWDDANLSIVSRVRERKEDAALEPSRTLLARVWREQVALLCNDVATNRELLAAPSLMISDIQSVLAVPLKAYGRLSGALYLASSDPQAHFDEGHLELLTAIGGIAAVALENVRRLEWLEAERLRLEAEIQQANGIIGQSELILALQKRIAKVAPADATVLIQGESGTGKELVARALHQQSQRAARPFVALNCAAIPENLMESELFGHERGAFTGAHTLRKGKLEIAEGGTLFLDEIGDMPLLLQAKLLRVLQERTFERLGSNKTLTANLRVVAATHRSLLDEVKAGRFREDLYYRLNVVSVTLPPLRERRADIAALAGHFARRYAESCKRRVTGIAPEAMRALEHYDWPGNVRELQNVIEGAVVLGTTDVIELEDLPERIFDARPAITALAATATYLDAAKEAKKAHILAAIEQAGGNITKAAQLLGVQPSNLHRVIRNLGLRDQIKS